MAELAEIITEEAGVGNQEVIGGIGVFALVLEMAGTSPAVVGKEAERALPD